ncbi:hypothetical protein EQO05_03395 [Methanosarcina sp. MSH10X1]|uniref:hypothetical protein n=1 Tax=Methanosarcina sp. MSH10X1 TaxID=2507075 RepID=UPI000FFB4204|nr:hypothetical protein [Methanosarcina sp. MSH10X1]RXA20788.1 hypothetical protein EQO05_03395 [Methanosarcina sp. MSH10X1]
MSERAILKTLIICLLIGCFLVSNISCVYASEASADSYENKTKLSKEEMQSPEEEAQNSGEELQPSEDTDTQTLENDETEDTGVQPFEGEDTQTSEDAGVEPAKETEVSSPENPEVEPSEENGANLPENAEVESAEESGINSENNETVASENTETHSSWDAEMPEETGTQTSGEAQVSEDTESESSYHRGNSYHIERSEYTKIENNYVQSEPAQEAVPENSGSNENSKPVPTSASVSLHGEKTRVVSGEDILLRLSAVNLITKPAMHVQVIIIPPSGMSVSSSEFVQSGAGQYTTTYELDPGQGRDIEVRIETNQPGDFNVKGRVVYYFGDDIGNAEDNTLDLPIQVEAKPLTVEESLPGFTLASLAFIFIAVFILKRR